MNQALVGLSPLTAIKVAAHSTDLDHTGVTLSTGARALSLGLRLGQRPEGSPTGSVCVLHFEPAGKQLMLHGGESDGLSQALMWSFQTERGL